MQLEEQASYRIGVGAIEVSGRLVTQHQTGIHHQGSGHGCALPLAIGVKLAAPERPVVCFTGDAGLEMVLGELATLRDLELPVVVFVFVDATLALIDLKQNRMQYPQRGVTFGETDWIALAQAMGGHGVAVESRAATQAAVEAALAAERFTLIAARIDPAASRCC